MLFKGLSQLQDSMHLDLLAAVPIANFGALLQLNCSLQLKLQASLHFFWASAIQLQPFAIAGN